MSVKNNPNLSVSLPDPENNNRFVLIESLYWLEYTPYGPVPTLALHRVDGVKNSKSFFDMHKQCYTFDEAKKEISNWYLQRGVIMDNMTELDFEKMAGAEEMNRADIRDMLDYLEDLDEDRPRTEKEQNKDKKKETRKPKKPKNHRYDCSCAACNEFWKHQQEKKEGVPMNEPSQLEKSRIDLKRLNRRLN